MEPRVNSLDRQEISWTNLDLSTSASPEGSDDGWVEDSDEEVPALRKLAGKSDSNQSETEGGDEDDFNFDESFLAETDVDHTKDDALGETETNGAQEAGLVDVTKETDVTVSTAEKEGSKTDLRLKSGPKEDGPKLGCDVVPGKVANIDEKEFNTRRNAKKKRGIRAKIAVRKMCEGAKQSLGSKTCEKNAERGSLQTTIPTRKLLYQTQGGIAKSSEDKNGNDSSKTSCSSKTEDTVGMKHVFPSFKYVVVSNNTSPNTLTKNRTNLENKVNAKIPTPVKVSSNKLITEDIWVQTNTKLTSGKAIESSSSHHCGTTNDEKLKDQPSERQKESDTEIKTNTSVKCNAKNNGRATAKIRIDPPSSGIVDVTKYVESLKDLMQKKNISAVFLTGPEKVIDQILKNMNESAKKGTLAKCSSSESGNVDKSRFKVSKITPDGQLLSTDPALTAAIEGLPSRLNLSKEESSSEGSVINDTEILKEATSSFGQRSGLKEGQISSQLSLPKDSNVDSKINASSSSASHKMNFILPKQGVWKPLTSNKKDELVRYHVKRLDGKRMILQVPGGIRVRHQSILTSTTISQACQPSTAPRLVVVSKMSPPLAPSISQASANLQSSTSTQLSALAKQFSSTVHRPLAPKVQTEAKNAPVAELTVEPKMSAAVKEVASSTQTASLSPTQQSELAVPAPRLLQASVNTQEQCASMKIQTSVSLDVPISKTDATSCASGSATALPLSKIPKKTFYLHRLENGTNFLIPRIPLTQRVPQCTAVEQVKSENPLFECKVESEAQPEAVHCEATDEEHSLASQSTEADSHNTTANSADTGKSEDMIPVHTGTKVHIVAKYTPHLKNDDAGRIVSKRGLRAILRNQRKKEKEKEQKPSKEPLSPHSEELRAAQKASLLHRMKDLSKRALEKKSAKKKRFKDASKHLRQKGNCQKGESKTVLESDTLSEHQNIFRRKSTRNRKAKRPYSPPSLRKKRPTVLVNLPPSKTEDQVLVSSEASESLTISPPVPEHKIVGDIDKACSAVRELSALAEPLTGLAADDETTSAVLEGENHVTPRTNPSVDSMLLARRGEIDANVGRPMKLRVHIKREPLSDDEYAYKPTSSGEVGAVPKNAEQLIVKHESDSDGFSTDIPTSSDEDERFQKSLFHQTQSDQRESDFAEDGTTLAELPKVMDSEYLSRMEKVRILQKQIEEQEKLLKEMKMQRKQEVMQRVGNPYLSDLF